MATVCNERQVGSFSRNGGRYMEEKFRPVVRVQNSHGRDGLRAYEKGDHLKHCMQHASGIVAMWAPCQKADALELCRVFLYTPSANVVLVGLNLECI
jgi:hypothetical protein